MQKARIKLACIDIDKLNQTCAFIKDISDKTGVPMRGPIPLPTKKLKVTTMHTLSKLTLITRPTAENAWPLDSVIDSLKIKKKVPMHSTGLKLSYIAAGKADAHVGTSPRISKFRSVNEEFTPRTKSTCARVSGPKYATSESVSRAAGVKSSFKLSFINSSKNAPYAGFVTI